MFHPSSLYIPFVLLTCKPETKRRGICKCWTINDLPCSLMGCLERSSISRDWAGSVWEMLQLGSVSPDLHRDPNDSQMGRVSPGWHLVLGVGWIDMLGGIVRELKGSSSRLPCRAWPRVLGVLEGFWNNGLLTWVGSICRLMEGVRLGTGPVRNCDADAVVILGSWVLDRKINITVSS